MPLPLPADPARAAAVAAVADPATDFAGPEVQEAIAKTLLNLLPSASPDVLWCDESSFQREDGVLVFGWPGLQEILVRWDGSVVLVDCEG